MVCIQVGMQARIDLYCHSELLIALRIDCCYCHRSIYQRNQSKERLKALKKLKRSLVPVVFSLINSLCCCLVNFLKSIKSFYET